MRFDFGASDDRELPLILGLMPVLAKHAINPDTFEETSMTPPIGSGPYVVGTRRSGKEHHAARAIRTIGARDLGVNRGFWNFDEIRFDYYRDARIRITRRSRKACSTCARRTIPAAGRPATISRRCATAAS